MEAKDIKLSEGSVQEMFNADPTDEKHKSKNPILQILTIKRITPQGSNTVDRNRVILSDGRHFMQSMMATQLNDLVEQGVYKKNSIIRVTNFTCNNVQSRRLYIILALELIAHVEDKIGEPVSIVDFPNNTSAAGEPTAPAPQYQKFQQPAQQSRPSAAPKNGAVVFPIESLSPYSSKWTIKARVSSKSEVRTYSNQKGEGRLFNVVLMDESGEIRGTGFNHVCDELYPKFEEGKVYFVSKARVNLAKKKFSNLSNEYELMFERNTEVEECTDSADVPSIKYNFVELSRLSEQEKDTTCDVIAVVKDIGDLGEIVSKTTNKTLTKRELMLVDQSGYSVRMTLWGKQAEQFNTDSLAIIAFKGARVGDFGGRSLSVSASTTSQVNPDITEAYRLRGWYDNEGHSAEFKTQAGGGGGSLGAGAGGSINRSELKTLDEVKEAGLGQNDAPDYFSCSASIMHIKSDNIAYPACPSEGCNKKVIQDGDSWRCEKCNKTYPKPEYRYIMSLSVADHTGSAWLQGFNDVGLAIFNKTADEVVEMKENNESDYANFVKRSTAQSFLFSCRAKQDTYNDQTRVRYGINRLQPLNYLQECQERLKTISLYS